MANAYSMGDLLGFLAHAGDRGMMPAATATALSVAVRNVLGVLADDERRDLSRLSVAEIVKRFNNKRARDFSPASLKEYGRRVQRAVDLYVAWRDDPANFSIKTRATKAHDAKARTAAPTSESRAMSPESSGHSVPTTSGGGYASSVPIRADWVVTISNVPPDLTAAEAERLAKFVRMLAFE